MSYGDAIIVLGAAAGSYAGARATRVEVRAAVRNATRVIRRRLDNIERRLGIRVRREEEDHGA